MTATQTTGPMSRVLRALPALTLVSVMVITASAEYQLARTVLALPPAIAWALPAAIDSYVLAALRSRRDVPAALAVMGGSLFASMGAHLFAASHGGELPARIAAPAAAAIMTSLVVVAWRVHVLIEGTPEANPAPGPVTPTVEAHASRPTEATRPPTPNQAAAPEPGQAPNRAATATRPVPPPSSARLALVRPEAARPRPGPKPGATLHDLHTAISEGHISNLSREQVKQALGVGSSTATRLITEYHDHQKTSSQTQNPHQNTKQSTDEDPNETPEERANER